MREVRDAAASILDELTLDAACRPGSASLGALFEAR